MKWEDVMATELTAKLKLVSSRVQDCANPIMEDEDNSVKQRRPGTVDRFLKSKSPTSEPPRKHGEINRSPGNVMEVTAGGPCFLSPFVQSFLPCMPTCVRPPQPSKAAHSPDPGSAKTSA